MVAPEQPLVTFALFAFNQVRFIREAVESVLAQTYSPLEIILSDDCSTDGTFRIMQEMAAGYKGPHKLIVNRNEPNQGVPRHIDTVVNLAGGDLIVVGAGDDISEPNRVSAIANEYLKSGRRYVAIYSALMPIDDHSNEIHSDRWQNGETADLIKMASLRSGIYGCSAAYSADLFHSFGSINSEVVHEDLVLPFRAAISGQICFLKSKLVKYRLHGGNVWNRKDTCYSKPVYMQRIGKFLPNDIAVIQQQIADFGRAQSISFKANKDARQLERILRLHLKRTKLELELLKAESCFAAMLPTLRLLCHPSSYKRGVRWLYLRFLPEFKWMNRLLLK